MYHRGNELEYREVITNFVNSCGLNHLYVNTSNTKEMVINFRRNVSKIILPSIQGLDIKLWMCRNTGELTLTPNWTGQTHRCPIQEGPKSSPSAEKTEVFWSI